jgi:hypothetical protein
MEDAEVLQNQKHFVALTSVMSLSRQAVDSFGIFTASD